MHRDNVQSVPSTVETYLRSRTEALAIGEIKAIRLTPLLLRKPLREVLERRGGLFNRWKLQDRPFGCAIQFAHKLKPSRQHPSGRSVEGTFDVLILSEASCVVASSLSRGTDDAGPQRLAHRAYPLAKRPFLRSTALQALIAKMATANGWAAISLDAMGHDRETRGFRRDMKHQPVDDAVAEMRDQQRHAHKLVVSFRSDEHAERLRTALDRYGRATVYRGSAARVVRDFLLPAMHDFASQGKEYAVRRAEAPAEQRMVDLVFPDKTFADYEDMNALCQSVREGDGLSVTTIHLNPYLQAQVLDFFTGAAADLLIMDDHTVSLVPRSDSCQPLLERIAATIFRFFGEADIKQSPAQAT